MIDIDTAGSFVGVRPASGKTVSRASYHGSDCEITIVGCKGKDYTYIPKPAFIGISRTPEPRRRTMYKFTH